MKKYKRPKRVLKEVRDFFERNPENFVKGQASLPWPGAEGGVAYCTLGAIDHFTVPGSGAYSRAVDLVNAEISKDSRSPHCCVADFNDTRGRAAIIKVIDRVIA